jgi:hypothetical protein
VRAIALCMAVIGLAACAGQESREVNEEEQAVRDFIEVRGLAELNEIRVRDSAGWDKITGKFIIYNTRRESFLFVFARNCYELDDNTNIVADIRHSPNIINARFDTLRGCRIDKIYALTEAEVAELLQIGEGPGSRN